MSITFPVLNKETRQAINTLGRWLAQDDVSPAPCVAADVIILAGNAVIPTIDAACRLAGASELPLVISGGIGHSTPFLYAAIAQHEAYKVLSTTGRAEAAILADIAHHFWNIPKTRIFTETRSTNCGENAGFTRALLAEKGLKPQRAIVAQDPVMQRRTLVTFARAWRGQPEAVQWLGYPGRIPVVREDKNALHFVGGDEGMWTMERYVTLLLGEIPRLRDDENGYGPAGKDFIEHVAIPAEVERAWTRLSAASQSISALRQRVVL
ncbi:YdcF family protein [Enterobacteriaceae bacterium YMB-R22]|jgi:uncharacterized SAM-binding protein YcdF (DUF218 family)|uniref:YdcF family protein n=1 Tax=Tenebrionicola larvae TaxID=2815733 RepID=A0A949V153_9ENTR|nr:YdcF family protein [Tenebrionicola larvae]MBV4411383.1 YdcF family protein [Tenebrionicola larvae]MBV5095823.1 YdcF family protein [Tenebrionicola larvae]